MRKANDNQPSRTQINREYNEKNYERIEITVLAGRKELIKQRAEEKDMSVNKYIKDLIDEDMGGGILDGQYDY